MDTERVYNEAVIQEYRDEIQYHRTGDYMRHHDVEQVFNPFKLLGRNDQCPCESGKKYKRCHG